MGGRARSRLTGIAGDRGLRYTYCWICDRKICVNNYPDKKVRLPKVRGVIVCPWCQNSDRGDFVSALYEFTRLMAERGHPTAEKVMNKSPRARRQAS